jgi:hypothetical protein
MKRAAYFIFLSALLSGCDGCRPANYAHVEFRDSSSGNFLLQAYSDSSVRLLNFLNDSMSVVRFDHIQKFVLQGDEIDPKSIEGKARMAKSLEPNPNIWHELYP